MRSWQLGENSRTLVILFLTMQLFVIITIIPIIAGDAENSNKLEYRDDILPYPFSRGSAVWVEEQESIYIFGGRNETDILDRIMRYTPKIGQIEILETKLPDILMGTTAVYNGKYIFIFGGREWDIFNDTILRFDPITETIITMNTHLPKPTVGAAAVWTGEYIYIFGGGEGPDKYDYILRYDPESDNIVIMNSTLTYGRTGLAAAWDGEFAYIAGGSDGRQYSAEVFKYSPTNDSIISLPELPTKRTHIQVEYHNGSLYIFGGRTGQTELTNEITKYDLETGKAQTLDVKLHVPTELRMHAYDGENIYIIGGFEGPKNFNQFIIFIPEFDPPRTAGPTCPPDNPYLTIYALLIILAIIIIVTLVQNYRKKT